VFSVTLLTECFYDDRVFSVTLFSVTLLLLLTLLSVDDRIFECILFSVTLLSECFYDDRMFYVTLFKHITVESTCRVVTLI
jgi:hypothetical protein